MVKAFRKIPCWWAAHVTARNTNKGKFYKNDADVKTVSTIKQLNEAERVEEIAKMIGGDKPSKVAVENTHELLVR